MLLGSNLPHAPDIIPAMPTPNPPPLISLRDVDPADLPVLFEHQLDPDACAMAVVNPRDAASFYTHWAAIFAQPSIIAKAILADSHLVGSISCFKLDDQDLVGYWIAKEHWGKGFATKALTLLLEQVTTRPLHARAARSNPASIRVLERCGFKITGYLHAPATDRYPACEEALLVLK